MENLSDNDVIKNNGVKYKKFSELGRYVICRTYSAGVFAGYLSKQDGQKVVLNDARRIWFWSGAASLSELAMHGTSKPSECKFPCTVSQIELLEAIEILDVSEKAKKSIENVPVWTCHE
jgi:hypothetical protein